MIGSGAEVIASHFRGRIQRDAKHLERRESRSICEDEVMVGDIAVYRLTPITGDPRYEGFGTFDEASFRTGEPLSSNFLPERIHSRGWQAPRLTSVWKPVRVRGRARKYNDHHA